LRIIIYSYNAGIASNAGGVAFNAGVTTLNAGVTTLNFGGGTHYVGVLEEYAVSGISGRKSIFS
jgi:hypothetical protein